MTGVQTCALPIFCFDPNRPNRRQLIALLTITDEAAFKAIVNDLKASVPAENVQFDKYDLIRLRVRTERPVFVEITRIRPKIAMIVTELDASVFINATSREPFDASAGRAGDLAYSAASGKRLANDPYYKETLERLGGQGDAFVYFSLPALIAAQRADWLAEAKRQPPPIDETEIPPAIMELQALDARLRRAGLSSCRGMGATINAANGVRVDAVCITPNALPFINSLSKSVVDVPLLFIPNPDLNGIAQRIDAFLDWRKKRNVADLEAEAVRRRKNLGELLDSLEAIERQKNSDAFLVQSTQLPQFLCEAGFMPESQPGRGWTLRLVIGSRLRPSVIPTEPVDLKTSPVAFWQPPENFEKTTETAVLFGDRSIRVLTRQDLTSLLKDDAERLELSPSMFNILTERLKIGPIRTASDIRRIEEMKKELESSVTPERLATAVFGMRPIESIDDDTLNYVVERFALSVRDALTAQAIKRAVVARYQNVSIPLSVSVDELRSHSESTMLVCHSFFSLVSGKSIEIINGDPVTAADGTRPAAEKSN